MRSSAKMHNAGSDETAYRLRDAFARVAMPTDALRVEKERPAQTYQELIQYLAREIDETVLPRRLVLVSGDQGLATLVVSNRRLIELEIGETKIEFGADGDADADSVARTYALALKKLTVQSGPIHVRPGGRALQAATSSTACTAMRLAEFSTAARFENRMKAFLKLIHARSRGWIYRPGEGEAVAHDPDTEIHLRLKTLEQQAIDQACHKGNLSRVNRTGPVCAAFALSDEIQVIIATDGKDRLVVALPHTDVAKSIGHWKQIFGRIDLS